MKIVFGENLKTFRRKLGLSQSELAKKLTEAGETEGISITYKNNKQMGKRQCLSGRTDTYSHCK